jgi:hypothetical protein
MQYDPTNTFDLYDIKSGSWLYMDTNGGLVFQSNTTGSLSTTVIDSGGTLNVSNNIVGTNGLNIQGNQNGNSWLHLSETNAINTVLGNDVGHIQITAYDQIEINSGGSVWTFSNDNFLHSPWGSKFLIAPEPTHSTGQPGDLQGMVAFSANGTYYCTADYVAPEGFDPEPDIWKRISWSSDTW